MWSNDGKQLAFILQKPKEVPQLALIQSDGGGIRTLTNIPYGVSHPVFSPDGAFIYAAVSLKQEESVHDEKRKSAMTLLRQFMMI
ncbi:hypothetical protein OE903_21785 [Bacillus sp. B6(2022)]|nr:hypothetical protein [Bacillus sp. B6(2022)]